MSRPPRAVRRTPLGLLVKGKSSTGSTSSSIPPLMVPALTKTKLEHVKSPHELTSFMETTISQLEVEFDSLSEQMMEKLSNMSIRIDGLENAIREIIEDAKPPGTASQDESRQTVTGSSR